MIENSSAAANEALAMASSYGRKNNTDVAPSLTY